MKAPLILGTFILVVAGAMLEFGLIPRAERLLANPSQLKPAADVVPLLTREGQAEANAAISSLRQQGLAFSLWLAGAVVAVSWLIERRATASLNRLARDFAALSRSGGAAIPPTERRGPLGELAASLTRLRALRDEDEAERTRLTGELLRVEQLARRQRASAVLLRDVASGLDAQPLAACAPAIQRGLAGIGKFLSADRAYLFDYDFTAGTTSNTFEWCADGVSPQILDLQRLPIDAIPDWVEVHRRGETLLIHNVEQLPPGNLREILVPQGIKSLVAVPLMERAQCIGFVGLDAVRQTTRFGAFEGDLLRAFADKLVGLRQRERLERSLREAQARTSAMLREQKTSLKEREAHIARTQFALDCVGIGITWIAADTGRILHTNGETCRQLGYTPEELLGLTVGDVNASLSESAMRNLAGRLRETGEPVVLRAKRRRKDGSTFPVELKVTFQGADGGDDVFIVFAQDITAQELDQHALEEARAGAQAANRAKSAFLANLSHEIRTPLNTILGVAHLIRSNCAAAQLEQISRIETAAQRLNTMLGDILDFSELEADRLQLADQEFAVGDLLSDVRRHLEDATRQRPVEVRAELSGVPERLRGDAGRLRQALMKYAANAAAFTTAGEIVVAAREMEASDDSLVVRFEVRDTGPGIPADVLGGLFRAFVQADSSNTRRHGGTGLGLAITRRLAELMGGEAGVESVPGRGSTFWYTARLRRPPELSPQSESGSPLLDPSSAPPATFRGRVLLAERSGVSREVLLHLLRRLGLETDVAVDHVSTLVLAGSNRYDLILLDVHIALMDGIDVLASIRRMPGLRDVPIVSLAAQNSELGGISVLRTGTVGEITLPADPVQLRQTLQRWLPAISSLPAAGLATKKAIPPDPQ